MKSKLKKIFFKLYDSYVYKLTDKRLSSQWINNCVKNGIDANAVAPKEAEYLAFWKKAFQGHNPDVYSYRLFSHYMGQVTYIIPEVLGVTLLEKFLNPIRYRDFYSDKNAYQMYLSRPNAMPKTLMAREYGGAILSYSDKAKKFVSLVDRKDIQQLTAKEVAELLDGYEKVCLKPSVDTCSGVGVTLLEKNADGVFTDGDCILDGKKLLGYGNDFVVQEVLVQHPALSHFNTSSINTLRICVYRSVVDDKCRATAAVMRVGAYGSFVDNAHAGGRYVGIDIKTGKLQHTTLDQYGQKQNVWNGIDYSKGDYAIPHWNEILAFAEHMGERNIHCRLQAFDICLDASGNPRVVEINVGGFSWWFFLYTGQDVFVGETEKVIDYCLERRKQERRRILVM